MGETKFLGIDLGTTNSVAAISDGDRVEAVRTADGGALLPSVVRIDARSNVTVGARARRFLDGDPENTRGEFKRLMGSGRRISFRAAKLDKTPEELSALVLGALRAAAEQALGHAPTQAVITVPALFELPQIRATSEAAGLAGFTRVEHIQEPVASALTAGHVADGDSAPWLVYDLGGGTFDVSLLETREGILRVVDHDGDNFLGGRDMDAVLLDHVLAELSKTSGRPLGRADATLGTLVRRLRLACEEAKLELGAGRPASVTFPDPVMVGGEELFIDVPVEPAAFERLVMPLVDKSVEVCLRLLERRGVLPSSLGRIVLVGGPTVMPLLKKRLVDRIGAVLATDVDPMTAGAEGAARFAAEHGQSTRAPEKKLSVIDPRPGIGADAGASGPADPVFLQYPSVSGDLFPFVVGRIRSTRATHVRIDRADGKFTSAEEKIDDDGSFVVQVELASRVANAFHLVGLDAEKKNVALEPSEIVIRHGLSLADPPLSRTIGVALATGYVATYFERGSPLPSRKTFRLRTSFSVRAGEDESAISVPIVQGEIDIARYCRRVGTIDIHAKELKAALPAGSAVDVVLELDRGGRLTATAYLPEQNVTFKGTLSLVSPDATIDELETQLVEQRRKIEALYRDARVGEAGRKKLVAIDARLIEAERERDAAKGADPDALEKLRRLLIDVDGNIADVEALRVWPELEELATGTIAFALNWMSRLGTEMERRTLDEAIRSLDRARAMKNASEFSARLRNIALLGRTAQMRDMSAVETRFRGIAGRLGEMRDARAGQKHVARGQEALAKGDIQGAREAYYSLAELLPPDEAERAKAHGSGVER